MEVPRILIMPFFGHLLTVITGAALISQHFYRFLPLLIPTISVFLVTLSMGFIPILVPIGLLTLPVYPLSTISQIVFGIPVILTIAALAAAIPLRLILARYGYTLRSFLEEEFEEGHALYRSPTTVVAVVVILVVYFVVNSSVAEIAAAISGTGGKPLNGADELTSASSLALAVVYGEMLAKWYAMRHSGLSERTFNLELIIRGILGAIVGYLVSIVTIYATPLHEYAGMEVSLLFVLVAIWLGVRNH